MSTPSLVIIEPSSNAVYSSFLNSKFLQTTVQSKHYLNTSTPSYPTMYPPLFFDLFLLLLIPTIDATPQLSPNNNNNTLKPYVVGRPNPVLPDPCGPPFGQPGNAVRGTKSTCDARASTTRPVNDPFRLQCQLDDTGYTMNWDTCRRAVGAACALLTQATNPTWDAWVWAPVFTSASFCSRSLSSHLSNHPSVTNTPP